MDGFTTIRYGTAILLAALAACRAEPKQRGQTVRDSARVALVEYGPQQPQDLEHWSLEPMPLIDVGNAEGDEAYLFTRIVHSGILPQGELLVADMGTSNIRIFDSTGRFSHRFGRRGGGPGEFEQLTWVGIDPTGAIATFDYVLHRISRFSREGALEKVIAVPSSSGAPLVGYVRGRFGDGSFLVESPVGFPDDPTKLSSGVVRDSIGLHVVFADGSRSMPAGRFPGRQNIRAVGPGLIAVDPAPFGLRTVIAVADTVFHVSTQEAYEIRTYGKDGILQRILRHERPPQPVGTAEIAAWKKQWDERLATFKKRPPPPQVTELAKYHTFPDVFPSHGDLLLDRVGNLWVEDYRPFPRKDTLTTWTVFRPDGSMLATATLPNVQITEIGADRVVGVWRGENDVPSVRVYRLTKQRP
jgi:hypothetical protein